MTLLLSLLFVFLFAVDINGQIHKKFVSNSASRSLFCSSCAMIANTLNHTLCDETDIDFETNVGFRLDSGGKKIRKNPQWLKIHLKLEDINCNWNKELFKIAKRKQTGELYLIAKENVKKYDKTNRQNREKAMLEKKHHFIEIGPTIVDNAKYYKYMDDMCLTLSELFDEWLHEKRAQFKDTQTDTADDNDLRRWLNMTEFCAQDLKHKQKAICADNMLKRSVDISSTRRELPSTAATASKLPNSVFEKRWLILDIAVCYGLILMVLSLFCVADAPIVLCKLCILALLYCPFYLHHRHPQFASLSTWILIWYWYAVRLWDIFDSEPFFHNKSFLFCWLHCAAMKNMFRASPRPRVFNVEAFAIMCAHISFMLQIHPFLFDVLWPTNSFSTLDMCQTPLYPTVILQLCAALSFVVSILYCADRAGLFLLNLCGYDAPYDMVTPWHSQSLREFWGKRWNQFVAYLLRKFVYLPVMESTHQRRYVALFMVFAVLGTLHGIPMWLDMFHRSTMMAVLHWFVSQPLWLYIDENYIAHLTLTRQSKQTNAVLHRLVTFAMLLGSFWISFLFVQVAFCR